MYPIPLLKHPRPRIQKILNQLVSFHQNYRHATSQTSIHLYSCADDSEECGDPLVQSGGRWKQDLAPVHKSKETQAWLQKECYDFVPFSHWPPSSLDLNLLDYFVWSYVENITNMTSHNIKASLITAICRVFVKLPPALVEKVCSQFWICIEVVSHGS